MTAEQASPRSSSLVAAAAVMILLSLLLFWLPVLGPLIAGGVGGRMAGSPGRGVVAALVPAIVLAVVVALVATAFNLPILGAIAGAGVFLVVLVQDVPLLVGAAIGGATVN